MSEVTTEPAQSSTSTTEQVKERVDERTQQLQEKASQAKVRTRERLREQIDRRSRETGEQMTSTASALRQTSEQLHGDQREPQARVLNAAIAGLLYLRGKRRVEEAGSPVPEQTVETVKEDVQWAKHPTTSAKT